ncbi:MAG: DUF1922 domain-containing protein [Methanophagales archaeon]|nr:DUF1922 domain-containing protein [Methanophagales archaeon]
MGFVCSCGRKLSRIIREDDEKLVYGCECGKEVETRKNKLLTQINTD